MKIFQDEHIAVFQSALYKVLSTVIETNDAIIVIDPAMLPNEMDEIRKEVDEKQGNKRLVLIFTHGDFDHIIGYQTFLGATVIGSIGMENHPFKEKKVQLINEFDKDYYIDRECPIEYPKLDIVIHTDGQKVQFDSTTLTFYLAPGHTSDGLFIVIKSLGVWVTGDYLSDFELPFINDSAVSYQQTLEKSKEIVEANKIQLLIPGHGKPAYTQSEMKRRIQMADEYLTSLIQAVKNEDEHEIDRLGEMHHYPSSFTKGCHEENIEVIKRELSGIE
ncbi:MBL fold metallo-hydrolase [Cytobacillus purgationiresistens]|uniref:Glyoxylase-like metal-dependent hydrolase (Beta-lactamase superfamily II) n=1 Tax=Cytobacillus purgationiresistens TaxID=863449 RepID=A0ABU0ALD0_9BACI|nr:MBL fold metallo-hydrolase [Cytobacillus purgationiresistens]MDQ0270830.1 glyoxylase-like metal-dependent hydrolase (beta-lactamase superfamily II) [Cytobacillus purgationiresistens]